MRETQSCEKKDGLNIYTKNSQLKKWVTNVKRKIPSSWDLNIISINFRDTKRHKLFFINLGEKFGEF